MNVRSGARKEIEDLSGQPVIAFCGLGNPMRFKYELDRFGLVQREFLIYRDHYQYGPGDIGAILSMAEEHGINHLITTKKDAVKIRDFDFGEYSVYSAELRVDITDEKGDDRLADLLKILDIK